MKLKRFFSLLLALVLAAGLMLPEVPVTEGVAVSGDGTYTWPVSAGYDINQGFYYNGHWGDPKYYHGGVDFPASIGSNVYAIASGTVIVATDNECMGSHYTATTGHCPKGDACKALKLSSTGSYANWIVIDHGNGITSLYAHLQTDSFLVNVGDYVYQGQRIAKSGNAGKTGGDSGAHLHFEIKKNNSQINPKPLLTQRNEESGVPYGSLDSASYNKETNILTVSGWVADPDDTDREIAVNIVVNGKIIGTGIANHPREDLVTNVGISPYHGFTWEFQLSEPIGGIQRVEARGLDAERGTDFMFGGKRVEFGPSGENIPIGHLDEVILNRAQGTMTVRGWAADPDDYSKNVDVHIVIGEQTLGHSLANAEHQGADAELGIGANHGFSFECPIPENLTGIQSVEAHGIDLETGTNYMFHSQSVDFSKPYGVLEEVIVDSNRILVRGWAKDPDDPNRAVDVHMVISQNGQGHTIGHAPANQYSAATGSMHGFSFECPISDALTGTQTVEAHGIDLEYGLNFQLDSKTVTIPDSCSCSPGFSGTYITTAPVNVYSGHTPEFSVLATIPAGTEIQIAKSGGLHPEHFGHVTHNGITGFVSMEYVRMNPGNDFYAYIILQQPWRHLTNDLANVSLRKDTGNQNQVWHFQRQSDGSYKITSVLDGNVLTAENSVSSPGANVKTSPDTGSNAQRWLLGGTQSQYFLAPKSGSAFLEVGNTAYPDGANAAVNKYTGDHNQRFHIWKLDNYTPSAPSYPQISFYASQYGMADGEYLYQEPITVRWETSDAVSCWLKIRNEQDGSYIIDQMVTTDSYTFLPPNIGTFTVAIRAYNHTGDSGRIERTLTVHGLTGKIWVSESEQGSERSEFPLGSQVFLNFSLTDPLTNTPLYDYLETFYTQVTLTLRDSDGALLSSSGWENQDHASFHAALTQPGTYTLTVESNRQSVFYVNTITFTVAECSHSYTHVTTPPTCTAQGFTTHTCSICADSFADSYENALGHIPGEIVGQDVLCRRCGEVIDQVNGDSDFHIPGDINGDGLVNNKDLTRLFRYLSGYDAKVVASALDVTGDGAVNNKDLTRLFRYLSHYDVQIH